MGLIFNGNGDVIKAVDGSLTVEGLDLGGGTNINAGIATFSGNVNVGGVLTYEDVKNVDSVGIVTARAGIHAKDDSTFYGATSGRDVLWDKSLNILNFKDNTAAKFGNDWDLSIYHNNSIGIIANSTGALSLLSDTIVLNNEANSAAQIQAISGASGYVKLFQNGDEKLATTSSGVTVTGDITISDKIIHAGDTNTAIRFPAADTFSVETAGQQNVQVDGTRVLLKSPAGTNTTVRLQHQGNSGYGDIILDRTVNAFIIDNDPSNASTNQSYFSVKNKGTENLRILHNGRVGIASAIATAPLNIQAETSTGHCVRLNQEPTNKKASIYFQDATTTGSDSWIINENYDLTVYAGYGGKLNLGVYNKTGITVLSNGFVGIGTDNPVRKLHVEDDNAEIALYQSRRAAGSYVNYKVGANGAELGMIGSGAAILSGGADAGDFGIRAAGDLCISSGGHAERLRIDSNGNMGLGDTAPPNFTGYKTLSIHGSTGGALVFGDDGTDEWEIYGGDGVLKVYDRANTSERLRIASGGQVIIGDDDTDKANGHFDDLIVGANASTTETHGITIVCGNAATNGGIAFSDGSNGGADAYRGMISYQHNDNHMQFRTNGTERLRITSDGAVGINKTSPNAGLKLHVGGTARFDDDVSIMTGKKLYTNSSQGQLTIQGGATYPGSAIKFAGGQGGATDQGEMIFYAGNATSLTERVRITIAGRLGVGSGGDERARLDAREAVNNTPLLNLGYNDGSFYRNLGTVGPNDDDGTNSSSGGQYLHVKLRTVWNDSSMTMFRITGYWAYSDYTESYFGCYRYNHNSYRSNPYGQIVHNQKRATLHSAYNTADSPGYLVLVLDSGTNYIGYMIEHIGAGGAYGAYMQQDLEILEVERSSTTDVWK